MEVFTCKVKLRRVGKLVGCAVVEEIMYVFSRWVGDQFNLICCEENQDGYVRRYIFEITYTYNGPRQIGDNS